jgi:hypothetical protein
MVSDGDKVTEDKSEEESRDAAQPKLAATANDYHANYSERK